MTPILTTAHETAAQVYNGSQWSHMVSVLCVAGRQKYSCVQVAAISLIVSNINMLSMPVNDHSDPTFSLHG